jgi:Ca2+-binding RTX toxin-like protein
MKIVYIDDHPAFGGKAANGAIIPDFASSISGVPSTSLGDATVLIEFLGDFESSDDGFEIEIEGFTTGLIRSHLEYVADSKSFTIGMAEWQSIIADGKIDIKYDLGTGTQEGTGTYHVEEYLRLTFTWDIHSAPVNSAPVVSVPLEDQTATQNAAFSFRFAPDAFSDPDADGLSYKARLADGSPLPDWLKFDAATQTFSGAPGNDDVGLITVRVTASDGAASAEDAFTITVANVNDAPSDIMLSADTVVENAPAGTVIGQIIGSDPDIDDVLGFSLAHNPGNAFALLGTNLVVATGARLDFETRASYDIVIRATDLEGAYFDKVLTVSLTDIVENPAGTSKDNRLSGDAGSNKIHGGGGHDRIEGRQGDDTLFGGRGDDSLLGGRGADRLIGGAGNDRLIGGAGADELAGGAGADRFIFRRLGESPAAAPDAITDFSRAEGDRIILRSIDADTNVIGDQQFSFKGQAGFHNVAGELRYQRSGSDTLISGDIDGDGVADFAIVVNGHINFQAGDFIL